MAFVRAGWSGGVRILVSGVLTDCPTFELCSGLSHFEMQYISSVDDSASSAPVKFVAFPIVYCGFWEDRLVCSRHRPPSWCDGLHCGVRGDWLSCGGLLVMDESRGPTFDRPTRVFGLFCMDLHRPGLLWLFVRVVVRLLVITFGCDLCLISSF